MRIKDIKPGSIWRSGWRVGSTWVDRSIEVRIDQVKGKEIFYTRTDVALHFRRPIGSFLLSFKPIYTVEGFEV